ncbi:hypothetical protein D9M73_204790 [compost metagenome]
MNWLNSPSAPDRLSWLLRSPLSERVVELLRYGAWAERPSGSDTLSMYRVSSSPRSDCVRLADRLKLPQRKELE